MVSVAKQLTLVLSHNPSIHNSSRQPLRPRHISPSSVLNSNGLCLFLQIGVEGGDGHGIGSMVFALNIIMFLWFIVAGGQLTLYHIGHARAGVMHPDAIQ